MPIHYINLDKELDDKFDLEKFFSFSKFVHDPLTSFFLEKLPSLPVRGRKTITTEVNRPDVLSYKIYRDTQYWWLLLEYNQILKFTDLKVGQQINYFSIDELEELYYTLKSGELKQITSSNTVDNASINENTNNNVIIDVSTSADLHRVYLVNNLDFIVINHDMNKRPTPVFVTIDNLGNEVAEEIFFRYTAGLETKQIVIILHEAKSGKVILN